MVEAAVVVVAPAVVVVVAALVVVAPATVVVAPAAVVVAPAAVVVAAVAVGDDWVTLKDRIIACNLDNSDWFHFARVLAEMDNETHFTKCHSSRHGVNG